MAEFTINRAGNTWSSTINPLLLMFDSKYELPFLGKRQADEVTNESDLKPNPYFFNGENIKGVLVGDIEPKVGDEVFFIDEKRQMIFAKSKIESVKHLKNVSGYGSKWKKYLFLRYSKAIPFSKIAT